MAERPPESQPKMIERTPPAAGEEALRTHELPPAPPRYALPPAPPRRPPSKLRFLWLLFWAVVAVVVYLNWPKIQSILNAPPPAPKAGKKGGRGGGGTAPVVATRARRGNIDVYIDNIGSVTPIYTTIMQSRVVGELMGIFYKEGDLVKKGDLLMQIDPRPYQVQLEQAQAQLSKDQAAL